MSSAGPARHVSCYHLVVLVVVCFIVAIDGEDPYRFFTWNVTYGDIYPLGVKQQVSTQLHSFHFVLL